MEYHVYRLLKSSCFELFGGGKYGRFWAKTLMERRSLLGLFELSMIFKDLGNMVFRAVQLPKNIKSESSCAKFEGYIDVCMNIWNSIGLKCVLITCRRAVMYFNVFYWSFNSNLICFILRLLLFSFCKF